MALDMIGPYADPVASAGLITATADTATASDGGSGTEHSGGRPRRRRAREKTVGDIADMVESSARRLAELLRPGRRVDFYI